MTLIESIKMAQITARKQKNAPAASVLTTLIGEAEMIGKNKGNRPPTDEEVIALIKKFISNIDETLALIQNQSARADLLVEKGVLVTFLPAQLSEDDLRAIISRLKNQGMILPTAMKYLKDNHAGTYDGKLASTIAKELL